MFKFHLPPWFLIILFVKNPGMTDEDEDEDEEEPVQPAVPLIKANGDAQGRSK